MNRPGMALLILLFISSLAATAVPESAAVTSLLALRPQLQGGGSTPKTFAAWANARYLLQDALYLGPVNTLGEQIEGHLFIHDRQTVLAFWSSAPFPPFAHVRVNKHAKLFAWGDRTGTLFMKTADLQIDAVPLFIRGVDGAYVAEAVKYVLTERQTALRDEAGKLLDAKVTSPWVAQQTTVVSLLEKGRHRDAVEGLRKAESALDALMQAVIDLPAAAETPARFALLHHLLLYRLQLAEMRAGVEQWQAQPSKSRTFSTAEQMKLSDALVHLLAKAEPRTALRGCLVTGGLLRQALNDLACMQESPAPREHNRIAAGCGVLSSLLALESPTVQNLAGAATVTQADGKYTLNLTLRNTSEETAIGSIQFTWGDRTVTKQFRLVANGAGELHFPLDTRPDPGFSVQMTGELTDGTPMRPTTLAVPEIP